MLGDLKADHPVRIRKRKVRQGKVYEGDKPMCDLFHIPCTIIPSPHSLVRIIKIHERVAELTNPSSQVGYGEGGQAARGLTLCEAYEKVCDDCVCWHMPGWKPPRSAISALHACTLQLIELPLGTQGVIDTETPASARQGGR